MKSEVRQKISTVSKKDESESYLPLSNGTYHHLEIRRNFSLPFLESGFDKKIGNNSNCHRINEDICTKKPSLKDANSQLIDAMDMNHCNDRKLFTSTEGEHDIGKPLSKVGLMTYRFINSRDKFNQHFLSPSSQEYESNQINSSCKTSYDHFNRTDGKARDNTSIHQKSFLTNFFYSKYSSYNSAHNRKDKTCFRLKANFMKPGLNRKFFASSKHMKRGWIRIDQFAIFLMSGIIILSTSMICLLNFSNSKRYNSFITNGWRNNQHVKNQNVFVTNNRMFRTEGTSLYLNPYKPEENVVIRRAAGGLRPLYHGEKPVMELGKLERKRGLHQFDRSLYKGILQNSVDHYPRVSQIGETRNMIRPIKRSVDQYSTEFSDNTQFYSSRGSDDEALSHMEIRPPYNDGQCSPMQDWQTAYYPSCNDVHEIDLSYLDDEEKDGNLNLFGTKGFWRNAWRLDLPNYSNKGKHKETFVMKTLKYNHNFEDAHFEHDRVDAMAMERLTSSPHVINIYGFCGHSVLTEFADGPRLGTFADKSKKYPLKRLEIARDIANGLADVHSIDGENNATFVHLDVNPANVVVIGKDLKLNDFNIGIMLKWNQTSNTQCGFPAQYPNPQWRSPEEANDSQFLTEKVDVFSMGHIFFRLICGHEPWNKLEKGGKPSSDQMTSMVKAGILPNIPDNIMQTTDSEVKAILNAMLECYTFDPVKRPSARKIASHLNKELQKLYKTDEKYLKWKKEESLSAEKKNR